MREVGVDLSKARPQELSPELAADASVLVTMGCGAECPYIPGARVEDWPIQDPKDQPIEKVRAIRDEIDTRVRSLLATL